MANIKAISYLLFAFSFYVILQKSEKPKAKSLFFILIFDFYILTV
jgi:hypothetical protein